jgi:hypothetical protein
MDSLEDLFKKHKGKTVKLKGHTYKVKYLEFKAIYPYPHKATELSLVPVNKRSKMYLDVKRKLGDDWVTDAKTLSDANFSTVYKQLMKMK